MPERVLSLRELNRTTLLRQLLLGRTRLRVLPAIERLAGLQAQWPPSPYVALWSRLDGFRREELERALLRERVVKATLMRATLHLVSARDYGLFKPALLDSLAATRARGADAPPARVVRRAIAKVRERPRTRRELFALLGYDTPPRPEQGMDPRPFREMSWLLLAAQLEQSPDAALWSARGATTFRRVEVEPSATEQGRAHLVRRYLSAFGPASRADLAQWSGSTIGALTPALESLRLRRFRDERGRELLDLPRGPLAEADVPAPPRLLPRWDELLLAHDDRRRVLPEEYRKAVIAKNGDVAQTFLVDGFVAGLWREEGDRIALEAFEPLPRAYRRELEDEARRLQDWLR